jgi:hypothetical protein
MLLGFKQQQVVSDKVKVSQPLSVLFVTPDCKGQLFADDFLLDLIHHNLIAVNNPNGGPDFRHFLFEEIFNRGLIAVSWDFFAERRFKETKREFLKINALNSDYVVDRGSGESDNERLTLFCFCHDLVVEKRDVGIIK